MTDRDKKIIIVSNPQIHSNNIFKDYLLKISPHYRSCKIPKRRLTIPELMMQRSPCCTCYKTNQECPDRKEDIVMCVGDKDPVNAWKLTTETIRTANKACKSMANSGAAAAEAAENMKNAFCNMYLGAPYEEKGVIDISKNIKSHWNTEPEDPIGDIRDYVIESGYDIPRSLWRTGNIITRDGNDEQEIIDMRSGDLIECRCIKEPPVYEGSDKPWIRLLDIDFYVADRCSFVRPGNKNIKENK